MRPTYHYDKNHRMIYVGQKVLADGKEYTVDVADTGNGGIAYTLSNSEGSRRLNDFGAMQLEVVSHD